MKSQPSRGLDNYGADSVLWEVWLSLKTFLDDPLKNCRTSQGSGDNALRQGRAIGYGGRVWHAAQWLVLCQFKAMESNECAADSNENLLIKGSSTAAAGGSGGASISPGSPPFSKALRTKTIDATVRRKTFVCIEISQYQPLKCE